MRLLTLPLLCMIVMGCSSSAPRENAQFQAHIAAGNLREACKLRVPPNEQGPLIDAFLRGTTASIRVHALTADELSSTLPFVPLALANEDVLVVVTTLQLESMPHDSMGFDVKLREGGHVFHEAESCCGTEDWDRLMRRAPTEVVAASPRPPLPAHCAQYRMTLAGVYLDLTSGVTAGVAEVFYPEVDGRPSDVLRRRPPPECIRPPEPPVSEASSVDEATWREASTRALLQRLVRDPTHPILEDFDPLAPQPPPPSSVWGCYVSGEKPTCVDARLHFRRSARPIELTLQLKHQYLDSLGGCSPATSVSLPLDGALSRAAAINEHFPEGFRPIQDFEWTTP